MHEYRREDLLLVQLMVSQNDNYEIEGACSSKGMTMISISKNLKIETLKMLGA